ncbi:NADH-quinone oxidoreductase subunit H, partial [Enorma sp.]
PYYDVRKLLGKEDASVNAVDEAYVTCALIFCMLAGGMFVSGSNLLMCIFLVTLATLFIIISAYSARSPFADTGADRECLQVMSYEPMLLIMSVGFFTATQSFDVAQLWNLDMPIIVSLVPIFCGLLFILTIKLRKSPFDLSYSHHAHQELVKGITTEMSGRTLAKVEIMHWCESVLFLMWVGMFFVWNNPASIALAVAVVAVTWFFEVFIDNNFARMKWQSCLKYAWIVALVVGVVNLFYVLITPFI